MYIESYSSRKHDRSRQSLLPLPPPPACLVSSNKVAMLCGLRLHGLVNITPRQTLYKENERSGEDNLSEMVPFPAATSLALGPRVKARQHVCEHAHVW